ncbi:MAG: hypothetical protein U1D25_07055 [Hydrogenophaga sp.]|nr:hypothetical protein [Hydrogenophaga sp.]MDZ4187847.1 hypothetical protein [Hydrogenophaga sp.]
MSKGHEISNYQRHFHRFTPPRSLEDIDANLKLAEAQIVRRLQEVTT